MSKRKICILFPSGISPELMERQLRRFALKFPDDEIIGEIVECNIKDARGIDCGPVIIDEVSSLPIVNRFQDNYVTPDLPSKKALRTSPYAIFDRIHRKRKR